MHPTRVLSGRPTGLNWNNSSPGATRTCSTSTRSRRPERKAALQAPDAAARSLWQVAFDNLGRHVKCGGVLFITDLLGNASRARAAVLARVRPEVDGGERLQHVRRQTGDR